MSNWGISPRIILLSLVPTFLVAIVMSIFFINSYSSAVDDSIIQRGKTIATHLAISSEYDIVSQNFINLKQLSSRTKDNDRDLHGVIYFDKNHRAISSSGELEVTETIPAIEIATLLSQANSGELIVINEHQSGYLFYAPIISSLIESTQPWDSNTSSKFSSEQLLGYVAIYLNKDVANNAKYKTLFASLLIALIGIFVGGLLAKKLAFSVTDPIQNMLKGINRIRDGRLDTRINTHSVAELKLLERGINSMAQQLEHNQEELKTAVKQATSDLQDTLETLEVNNLELDLARKQALEASRIKTEFLANMGHEIRTPMNGVIGFTDLLLKTELNNKQKDFLLDIKRSASNLLSIIDDILDYSKIEAGKMSLERYPFDLRECVDDVFSMLGPNANKKGLELVSLIYSDIPNSLLGDPIRIKQIITNLINNAIKFTKAGSIELLAEIESETDNEINLKIQVKDTGIGMNSEQQNSLFKAFNQADASTKRIFGGTGLGLVISKSLVEKMGGEINVSSVADQGSTFWFTIRCERAESAADPESSYAFLAHKTALVFDAHPASRLSITQMLEDLHMSVTSFETIDDLATELELYQVNEKNVEIVVVGGQNFKRRKSQLEYVCEKAGQLNSPVISFSTAPDVTALEKLQSLGVTRTLRKPVTHRNLHNALLETLRNKIIESDDVEVSYNLDKLKNLYVLAVDDNAANLRLVKILLTELGLNVDTAESGIQAISLSKDKVYDLILMDIQMPEIDGLEATRTIKANNTNAKTPIVALTAHAMANEKEQLLEAGMDDYMTKPVSENDLIKTLFKWTQDTNIELLEPEDKLSQEEATLDWALSLKLANNNSQLATDMLKMLVDSNFETSKQIHAAFQAQEFENLLHQVHKLHGASCYIGTPKLKRLSSEYETKLKKQQFNSIDEVHSELLSELNKINLAAKPYLEQTVTG
ncbi:MAG: two-component sensor histidine kinase BarA [Gammaproteobacteria bacterium]|nr:two-component sensor histidine kinase BarA [Gammaproteobacteria bacterium]